MSILSKYKVHFLASLLIAIVGCASQPEGARSPQKSAVLLNNALREEVVTYSMWLVDKDYRFGGQTPETGFDCSGMVSYVFMKVAGIKLPHNAAMIAKEGKEISRSRLMAGDLVFFKSNDKGFAHVGIYIGNDRFIHAPNSMSKVKISRLSSSYYNTNFQTAITFF